LSSEIVALLLCAALLLTTFLGLSSKKVSTALIMLFYSSVVLGTIFTVYGDALIGLLHMVTFAGAVSVLILTVILMTGQSDVSLRAKRWVVISGIITSAVVVASALAVFGGSNSNIPSQSSDISIQLFSFIWAYRPWDLLILVMVFGASMLVVANLFSMVGDETANDA
jgi:NADH:ubiquinone oxidoreductase subunit 6 (subunit J)